MIRWVIAFCFCTLLAEWVISAGDPEDQVVTVVVLDRVSETLPVYNSEVNVNVAGEEKNVVLRLVNKSNNPVEFKDLQSGCACRKVSPKDGTIPVGDSLDMTLSFRTPDHVVSADQSFTLYFNDSSGQGPAFAVVLKYHLGKHLAFTVDSVVVPVAPPQKKLLFRVPIIMGNEVKENDIYINLRSSIDIPFEYKLIDRGFVEVAVDLSKSIGKGSWDRIFCDLDLGTNSKGIIKTLPIVLEESDGIRLFPAIVRFDVNADGSSSATLIAKRISSKPTDSSATPKLRATASIEGNQLVCTVESLNQTTWKIDVKAQSDELTKLVNGTPVVLKTIEFSLDSDDVSVSKKCTFLLNDRVSK